MAQEGTVICKDKALSFHILKWSQSPKTCGIEITEVKTCPKIELISTTTWSYRLVTFIPHRAYSYEIFYGGDTENDFQEAFTSYDYQMGGAYRIRLQ